MATIDFTKRQCPNCGARDFSIRSRESLTGTCGINVFGPEQIDWDGYTDIEYDAQRTEYFFCNDCETELPAEWQEAIWRALNGNIASLASPESS